MCCRNLCVRGNGISILRKPPTSHRLRSAANHLFWKADTCLNSGITAQAQTPPSDSLIFVKSITSAHSLANEGINQRLVCPEAPTQSLFELETTLGNFNPAVETWCPLTGPEVETRGIEWVLKYRVCDVQCCPTTSKGNRFHSAFFLHWGETVVLSWFRLKQSCCAWYRRIQFPVIGPM